MESATVGEEPLKRNTDCIYFLASPLTCKKGNECEFRHSEGARVNPRDCWYWMHGNCLNPTCAFRHPPLDGLFGTPGVPSGPSPSAFQAGFHASGAYNPNKQSVPCYYFQKGQCLKADKCPFMHGTHPTNNNSAEQASTVSHPSKNNEPILKEGLKLSTSLTKTSQTVSWGLQECNNAAPINNMAPKKSTSPYLLEYEPPRSKLTVTSVSSDSTSSRPRHPQLEPAEEHYSNAREADDFLAESSPGFDVLVDGEEDYRRNLDRYANDFDYHHPDYEPVAEFERDRFSEKSEYDRYGRERDRRRSSSERMSKRRLMHRGSSPEEKNGLDLRHLLKQRRLSSLRSIASPEPRREDRYLDRSFSRDRRHAPPLGSSLSSRLQGRIMLPPKESVELQSETERERGRTRGRYIEREALEFNAEGRGSFGVNFAGPKSLAELKGAKVSRISQDQQMKSIIMPVDDASGDQELGNFDSKFRSGDVDNADLDDEDDEEDFAKKVGGFFP